MRKTIIGVLVAVLILWVGSGPVAAADPIAPAKPGKFGPWYAHDDFEKHLADNKFNGPCYIVAAEGRLHNGVSEWRTRWARVPKGAGWEWYWWYDSSGPYYLDHVQSILGQKGIDQIWLQSFVNEKGERKYQAVFLKITPHPQEKPSVPPPPKAPAPVTISTTPPVPKPHPIPAPSQPVQVLPGVD